MSNTYSTSALKSTGKKRDTFEKIESVIEPKIKSTTFDKKISKSFYTIHFLIFCSKRKMPIYKVTVSRKLLTDKIRAEPPQPTSLENEGGGQIMPTTLLIARHLTYATLTETNG